MVKNILIIVIFLGLYSCKKNGDLLIDNLTVTPTVNPNTGIFSGGDQINAWLKDEFTIEGYGNNYAFSSSDDLKTFKFMDYVIPELVFNTPTNKSIFKDRNGELIISGDNGSTNLEVYGNSGFATGFEKIFSRENKAHAKILNVFFLNKDKGWLMTSKGWSHLSPLQVYSIAYGETTLITEVFTAENYPQNIFFLNDNLGFALLNDLDHINNAGSNSIYFAKTSDGGKSWSNKKKVFSNTQGIHVNKMLATNENHIVLYRQDHNNSGLVVSYDGGENWKESNLTGRIGQVQFVDSKIGFAVVRKEMYSGNYNIFKTIDGGLTWEKITSNNIYLDKIHFYNELVGLAIQEGKIQITRDGGKTWKLIAYPY
jgi:photosystem II stability/assembly factor-like uncharacterized protein